MTLHNPAINTIPHATVPLSPFLVVDRSNDPTAPNTIAHAPFPPKHPCIGDDASVATGAAPLLHLYDSSHQWHGSKDVGGEEVIIHADPSSSSSLGGGGLVLLCNAQSSEDVADFYRRDNPFVRFNRAGAIGARCLPPAWYVRDVMECSGCLVGWGG